MSERHQDSSKSMWVLLTALGVVIRLLFIEFDTVHDDASTYIGHASELLNGTLVVTEHVGAELLFAAGLGLFGASGPTVVSFVAACLTVPVVGLTAASLFDTRVGYATALVFAVNPIHIYYSGWAYPEPLGVLTLATGLYYTVRGRYVLALLVGAVGLTFRLEYILLVQAPAMWLYYVENRSVRYGALVVPPVVLGIISIVAAVVPLTPQQVHDMKVFRHLIPFTVSFFNLFLLQPVRQTNINASFFLPHLLHWGVPYWNLSLTNPLLAGLFFAGVWRLTASAEWRRSAVAVFVAAPSFVLVYKNIPHVLGLSQQVTAPLGVAVAGVIGAILYLGTAANRSDVYPLLATVPYWCLLSISYVGTRYLLPIMLVYSLYAGFGLVTVHEWVTTALSQRYEGEVPTR